MRRPLPVSAIALTAAILAIISLGILRPHHQRAPTRSDSRLVPPYPTAAANNTPALAGAAVEEAFFAESHQPYGSGLPPAVLDRIWTQIHRLEPPAPPEPGAGGGEEPWELLGPRAMLVMGGNEYYGRVLDLEAPDPFRDIRVAAASGGLWEINPDDPTSTPTPISDQLESLAIGSFATNPTNRDEIVVGTGEPGLLLEPDPDVFEYAHFRTGVGVWRSADGGQTWAEANMSDPPGSVYRVRWDPMDPQRVHLVAHNGYWRSDNGGRDWTRNLEGTITDIVFHPSSSQIIFVGRWHETNVGGALGGLYKSTMGGDLGTWSKITHPVLPAADMGRISLAISGTDPAATWIYASMAGHTDPGVMLGFYRSTDGGASWTNLTGNLSADDFDRQGDYNNAVAAHPDFPATVHLGWIKLHTSTDGGMQWAPYPSRDLVHDDQHIIRYGGENKLLVGNDGGVYLSTNGVDCLALPHMPISDLVVNPGSSDILYVASLIGSCFKSTNEGTSWLPWNDGWPPATIVADLVPVFIPEDNEFWIYAGTYGRSAWRRNLAVVVSSVAESPAPEASAPTISVTPNPFRGSASLAYRVHEAGPARLIIHDVSGRRVCTLASGSHAAGEHQTVWNGRDDRGRRVAAGLYFARVTTRGGGGQSTTDRAALMGDWT